ncbi:hypothetical protein [Roseateles sp.]|uniref:hypothetical protein n=1 Tax=Roseateles sp. TaxID=1971397 RepID=UPI0039EA5558
MIRTGVTPLTAAPVDLASTNYHASGDKPMHSNHIIVAALGWACATAAMAQPPATEGEWRASYTIGGMQRQAEVIFKGDAGTWMAYNQAARDRTNPCTGRRMPMIVESREGGRVQVLVQRSAEVAGCADFRLELRVAEGRLEGVGRMAEGEMPVVLTKK